MKKSIFLAVTLLLTANMSVQAQLAKITLSHNGNLTMFDEKSMSSALSTAVDGDTIFLNEGTFSGNFTIEKRISLIGAGQKSIINGDITISIQSGSDFSSSCLENLNITGILTTFINVKGFVMKKCSASKFSPNGIMENAKIESCRFSNVEQYLGYGRYKNITYLNTKIGYIQGPCDNWTKANIDYNQSTFVHCNIQKITGVDSNNSSSNGYLGFCGTIINSIVDETRGNTDNSRYAASTVILTNCLVSTDKLLTYSNNHECQLMSTSILNSDLEPTVDMTSYIGNDGTQIGIYGGTNPFSLEPTTPKVESYNLKVDNEKKTINVNVKVSAK